VTYTHRRPAAVEIEIDMRLKNTECTYYSDGGKRILLESSNLENLETDVSIMSN
jgi:hypothetical protein